MPRCIHLAGADGSGKTTPARLWPSVGAQRIAGELCMGRFPAVLGAPLLAYPRCAGEPPGDGRRHRYGYWDFRRSWLMTCSFRGCSGRYVIRRRGESLPAPVAWEPGGLRSFVADILVDLMLGLGDDCFDRDCPVAVPRPAASGNGCGGRRPGYGQAVQRSPGLAGDRTRSARRDLYLALAARRRWPVVSASVARRSWRKPGPGPGRSTGEGYRPWATRSYLLKDRFTGGGGVAGQVQPEGSGIGNPQARGAWPVTATAGGPYRRCHHTRGEWSGRRRPAGPRSTSGLPAQARRLPSRRLIGCE